VTLPIYRRGYDGAETADPSALTLRHSLGGTGGDTRSARRDHSHTQSTVSTAAPGTSRMNDTAAEGTATTLARSDHKHSREQIIFGRVAASENRALTTYGDLATVGPAVTLVTGAQVKVSLSVWAGNSTIANGAFMSVAVSGATTQAARDIEAVGIAIGAAANDTKKAGHTVPMTGLTPGTNTFTCKYRAVTGGTATFLERFIIVETID
jgi:hypothetical protein